MNRTWVRVKEIGDGSIENPYRPKYGDQVNGWSGHRINNSPHFVCQFYAESQTLSGIESKSDVKNLTENKAFELLNNTSNSGLSDSGRPWNKEEINKKFNVG